jgi:RNA polymerase sigma-70 factor (ECF subfamily)
MSGSGAALSAFPTTVWSHVATARAGCSQEFAGALSWIAENYWQPIYCFIRHKGRSHEEASDLTQDFFTNFIEKDLASYADRARGRFRTFLLAAVSRFLLLKGRSAARRPKIVSLPDASEAEWWDGFEPTARSSPERVFMKNWAKRFLERCIARLRDELHAVGKQKQFEVFRLRLVLTEPLSTREVAQMAGMTVTGVVNYLHRAKAVFRRIAREELLSCGTNPADVEEELRCVAEMMSETREVK